MLRLLEQAPELFCAYADMLVGGPGRGAGAQEPDFAARREATRGERIGRIRARCAAR